MKQGIFTFWVVIMGVLFFVGTMDAAQPEFGTIGNQTLFHDSIVIICKKNYTRLSVMAMQVIEGELLKLYPSKEEEIKNFISHVKIDDILGHNCTISTSAPAVVEVNEITFIPGITRGSKSAQNVHTMTTTNPDTPKTQPQPEDGSTSLAWSIPLISIALIAMLIGGCQIDNSITKIRSDKDAYSRMSSPPSTRNMSGKPPKEFN